MLQLEPRKKFPKVRLTSGCNGRMAKELGERVKNREINNKKPADRGKC